jgi:thymidine phosphorylase
MRLVDVGIKVGLEVTVLITDGTQPVGRGIGPALEAHDVLAVLQGRADAPADLRDRSVHLAGMILELSNTVPLGAGGQRAAEVLASGVAWRKFQAICLAQGGLREPPHARYTHPILAKQAGRVSCIDNRRLARTARLAGAPHTPAAGLEFLAPLGIQVEKGQPLFVLHADAPGVMQYALDYIESQPDIVNVEEAA